MATNHSEQFHSALISQYKDMIHEALIESNHLTYFDLDSFNLKLKGILTTASLDGLTLEDILELSKTAKYEVSFYSKAA